MESQLNRMEHLVKSASTGNPNALGKYAAILLAKMLNALRSPLAAPRLASLIIYLRTPFWPLNLEALGDTVAHVTLR